MQIARLQTRRSPIEAKRRRRSLTQHVYIQLFVQAHVTIERKTSKKLNHQIDHPSIKLDIIKT